MSNEIRTRSSEIVDELIQSLLAKTEFDENLAIELYGYPADFLNDPTDIGDKSINERYNALVDGNEYFRFVFCYTGSPPVHYIITPFRTK